MVGWQMKVELERICKGGIMTWSMKYTGIYLQGLMKTTKKKIIKTTGDQAEIQTRHPLNTSLEHHL